MGEVAIAFVVQSKNSNPDSEEIISWSRERIANFKVPRKVIFVESLPTNASGKVLKFELRERVKDSKQVD